MGTYIDTTDVYERWGKDNVDEWASLDNQATPTAATRITTAISYAEQRVEDVFRDSRYEVPFSFNTTGAQSIVDHWMATLAGVKLYHAHGQARGEDEKADEMRQAVLDTEDEMALYVANARVLDAQESFSGPTAPHV